jgi:hypothetical protein
MDEKEHVWHRETIGESVARTQNNLSRAFSLGLGRWRLKTTSCCRSARFSSRRVLREQNRPEIVPKKRRMIFEHRSNIAESWRRKSAVSP